MAIDMVLNERSFDIPAENSSIAQQWMIQLIETIRAAQKLGLSTLRTHTDLNTVLLAENYSIVQWRNDRSGNVDREAQRFFRSLQTKSPFIDPLNEPEVQEQNALSEFICHDLSVLGLGIAYLLDNLALSFPSADCWNVTHLKIQHDFLDSETNELIRKDIHHPHASHPNHLNNHHDWIADRTGSDQWTLTDQALPSYVTQDGKKPIEIWLNSLKDKQTKSIIESRLSQLKRGILGDYKQIVDGEGVIELRIFVGPGYRIYCGRSDPQFVVLWAGDKSSQKDKGSQKGDISIAKSYWQDWKKRK